MSPFLRLGLLLLLIVVPAGCKSSEEGANDVRDERPPEPTFSSLTLAPADRAVRTVQLYRGAGELADETSLAVVALDGDDPLTLEFDLMQEVGEPLSVYFYHADRAWQRDLSPAEYMDGYRQDDILDYSISGATEVPYVHYEYVFPNETIRFGLSGNYIVRVTRQGAEDDVLFERPFFVTERSVTAELQLRELMVGGGAFPATQAILLFAPPPGLQTSVFDYQTCFVRNGRIDEGRCSERNPRRLDETLAFELDPDRAFESVAANYFLDLSQIDLGGRIERLDRSAEPDEVLLAPDLAGFGGSTEGPPLNGQTVVSGAVNNPRADVDGEYAEVTFSFVPPDEQRLAGEVLLSGSFNDWRPGPDDRLVWRPEAGLYSGTFLLKQGWYEYQYVPTDRRARRELAGSLPARQSRFAAFVYYDDISYQTDRLVGVSVATPGRP